MSAQEAIATLGLPALPTPLPRTVIDSHTHLDSTTKASKLSLDDNLAAAASVGIDRVVHIACTVPEARWAVETVKSHPNVIATVALHPNDAARCSSMEDLAANVALIDEIAGQHPSIRGIGETGLDYYRTRTPEGIALQKRSFADHIEIAKRRDLTLVIHDREAHDDILTILDECGVPERVIMHCFSGDVDFARECLDRGAWLSFPGTLTYPSAPNLRRALAVTPLDKLLVETDAPYLTAVPNRGKWNAPYLVPHLVRYIADLLQVDLAELCNHLTANAEAAYNGSWGEHG